MYAAADVLLLNQKAAVKDAVIPSKLLTYMASGRPVLCSASTESVASQLIRKAGCGLVVEPEAPGALVEGAIALRAESTFRAQMGTEGRQYVERNYNKARVLDSYDQFFEMLLQRQGPVAVAAD